MQIQPYGLMIVIGILVSGGVGCLLCKRYGVDFNDMILLFTYGLSFGFAGGKLVFLLVSIRSLPWGQAGFSDILTQSGFVFYGGIPFGLVGILLAKKLHRIDLTQCLPLCAPLIPLGHAFGRIGCSLVGCCRGMAYDGPCAITYYNSPVAPNGQPFFPVQLLEAVLLFLLAGVLLVMLFKQAGLDKLALTYLVSYAVMRFLLEFLRGDAERGSAAGLSTSQWISVALTVIVPVWYVLRRKRKKPQ